MPGYTKKCYIRQMQSKKNEIFVRSKAQTAIHKSKHHKSSLQNEKIIKSPTTENNCVV